MRPTRWTTTAQQATAAPCVSMARCMGIALLMTLTPCLLLAAGPKSKSARLRRHAHVYDGRTLQPYEQGNRLRESLGANPLYGGSSIGPSYGTGNTLRRSKSSTGTLGSTSIGPSYMTGGSLPLYNNNAQQPASAPKTPGKTTTPLLP